MSDLSPLEAIFFAALEKGSPSERAAYLEQACAGDPERRQRVERMLAAQARSFLEEPARAICATVDEAVVEKPGCVIGPYKLLEQIGEGGFGVVFMAEQTEPVRRKVALKILKPGMDTRLVVARFEAERQALAIMDHPNIAKVFDGGSTESPLAPFGGEGSGVRGRGRPYFVMELVKGVPITQFCDEQKLTPRQRLELFIPVCQAVQHAHQKGIIHRDLKPYNVLVSRHDTTPIVKVIDFGVAKALGQTLTDKTLFTGIAQMVGTPLYMSPEQAGMSDLDVDTRSDIYSLGVLLYELLTGTTPFSKERFQQAAYDEIRRIIREEDPPKPSTRLSESKDSLPSISAQRQTEPAKLTKLVRGELDWIVMKALDKDRNRRYETANGFAMDVQRYLADEAVQACPPSAAYRLRKFARRNKGPVLAAGLVLATLLAGIAGTTFGLIRAVAERKKAEDAEEQTLAAYRANADDAIELLIGSKPELGPQEKAYLEKTLERWQAFANRQGEDERSTAIRGEGHHRVAHLWQQLGRLAEARAEYETARDLRKRLAEQFPGVPTYQHHLARTHNNLGSVLIGLGQSEAARVEYERARDIHKTLADQYPDTPAYQFDLAKHHFNLGEVLRESGQLEAARAEFEKGLDLNKILAKTYPDEPAYQQDLAMAYRSLGSLSAGLGRREAAQAAFENARDLQQKLAAQYPAVPAYQQELATTHGSLGMLLEQLVQHQAARAEFEKALEVLKKLTEHYPAVPQYQSGLADAYSNLGGVFSRFGQHESGRMEYEKARDLSMKLSQRYPADPMYRYSLAKTRNNLGVVLAVLGQPDAARREYEGARDLYESLAEKERHFTHYQFGLASTHSRMGDLFRSLGQPEAARRAYEKGRDLWIKLAEQNPAVPNYQINLGGCYCNLGIAILEEGHAADSLAWFDKAIATLAPVHRAARGGGRAKEFLRNTHGCRAMACNALQRHAEAIQHWEHALELSSPAEQGSYRTGLLISRIDAGQAAEVLAEVEEGMRSLNRPSSDWYYSACLYALASAKDTAKQQEYADRAMELLHRAVQAGFEEAADMKKNSQLDALRRREDFRKLLAELEARPKAAKEKGPLSK